jgi:3-dehydroquinate synthase
METGLRRILNFGHTVGHGIEKLGNFTELSHGEAVSVGMAAAAKLGENAGITKSGCYERLAAILKSLSLPIELTHAPEEVFEALLSDKKRQGDSIHFIFIEDFGRTEVKKIPVAELKQMMKVLGD